ncbi:isoprenylcysteine carboxylmethyltransferase family protein, partial [Bacillus licheniformis]
LAVALEFLLLPLLFQAYATALLFTVLNAAVMYIRIRTEEQALEKLHH